MNTQALQPAVAEMLRKVGHSAREAFFLPNTAPVTFRCEVAVDHAHDEHNAGQVHQDIGRVIERELHRPAYGLFYWGIQAVHACKDGQSTKRRTKSEIPFDFFAKSAPSPRRMCASSYAIYSVLYRQTRHKVLHTPRNFDLHLARRGHLLLHTHPRPCELSRLRPHRRRRHKADAGEALVTRLSHLITRILLSRYPD
jgi:hypothetical protein